LSGELLLELKETTAPGVAALGDDTRAAVDEVVEMLRGNLDKIAEHGKRADGIVKSMLEHSRGVSGERRVVDLNALIDEALNLAYHGARAQDASFSGPTPREMEQRKAVHTGFDAMRQACKRRSENPSLRRPTCGPSTQTTRKKCPAGTSNALASRVSTVSSAILESSVRALL
jgi:hypothetical protein